MNLAESICLLTLTLTKLLRQFELGKLYFRQIVLDKLAGYREKAGGVLGIV